MHSSADARRKGLVEAGAPSFVWPRGTEARWSRDGRWAAEPAPTQCQAAGATSYTGSCPGAPRLGPGRGAGGGTEHPRCLQGSASLVCTSSARLACTLPGLVLLHPCFGGAGAKHCPSVRGGQKGNKTSLSPRAPLGLAVARAALQGGGVPEDRGAVGLNHTSVGWGTCARAGSSPRCSAGQRHRNLPGPLPSCQGGGRVPPRCCGTKLFITLNYLFIVLERQLLFMTLGPRGPGVI